MAMAASAPSRLFFSLVKPTPMATLVLSILFLSLAVKTIAAEQKSAFDFIKQLAGSKKGQHVGGLMELKKYLKQFGYLGLHHLESDVFDDALETAIIAYQLSFHMKATGKMDEDTVKQMMRPRCGVSDHIERTRQWPSSKTHLTYKFHYGAKVPLGNKDLTKSIFAQAFQRWAEVSHFTFEEVQKNSPADIEIEFGSGHHGDDSPFDGAGGVLGHASPPESGVKPLRFHLDADDKWSANPGAAEMGMDLESAAIHLIGHLLGLDHNTQNPAAAMYPFIDKGVAKRHLSQDDIDALHALYGLN